MKLYPLQFTPLYKYRIWGGEKLKTELNKQYTEENIGESWEISDVSGDETVVAEGALKGQSLSDLIKEFKGDFVGNAVHEKFGEEFPLLIKFIDAKTPLSIQVHPSNEVAKERHNSFGKNEMWYVMQADKDAELIVGFDEEINTDDYKTHLENNTILNVMHHENVQKGDTFYIPTGRVHAIGAGVLLAEIQQTSDVTYRIYDYDRVDSKTGIKRELHNELAIDVIDYEVHDTYKTDYSIEKNVSNTLVHSPYFRTNILDINSTVVKDYSVIDSFIIYMCVEGSVNVISEGETYTINNGETFLLPASLKKITLQSENARVLEVYYPQKEQPFLQYLKYLKLNNMKKIIVLLLLLTVSVTQAQKNQKAVALAEKLSKVMEFDEDQSAKLLELILDRNNKKRALRKEYADDKDTFKVKAKEVEKAYNKDLRVLAGIEKFKLLVVYRKAKRAANN